MALADSHVLAEQHELRLASLACDLRVQERLRRLDRRDADLEPRVLAVRALAGTADADPAGNVPRRNVRSPRRCDRRPHAVPGMAGLVTRVGVVVSVRVVAARARASGGRGARLAAERGKDEPSCGNGEEICRPHLGFVGGALRAGDPRSRHRTAHPDGGSRARRDPAVRTYNARDGDDRRSRHLRLGLGLARGGLRARARARGRACRRSRGSSPSRSTPRTTPSSTTRAISATRASIPSREACTRRCTAAACGRCGSSRASGQRRRRMPASAICATTGRPASRPRSTCRR